MNGSTTIEKANGKELDSLMLVSESGLKLQSLPEMLQFAEYVFKSEFCPKGFKTAGDVLVALQMSMELGLAPMSGLQNIGVINGRPGIYGDAALALVYASGLLEYINEEYSGNGEADAEGKFGDKFGCKVTVKRRDMPEVVSWFTIKDAERAGLWKKTGPWTQYPRRMLKFRARGFALRDAFPDVLKGMVTFEEARDYAPMRNVTDPKTAAEAPAVSAFELGGEAPADTAAEKPAKKEGAAK